MAPIVWTSKGRWSVKRVSPWRVSPCRPPTTAAAIPGARAWSEQRPASMRSAGAATSPRLRAAVKMVRFERLVESFEWVQAGSFYISAIPLRDLSSKGDKGMLYKSSKLEHSWITLEPFVCVFFRRVGRPMTKIGMATELEHPTRPLASLETCFATTTATKTPFSC